MLRSIFDVDATTAKIQDLEQQAAQPELWDNQERAQQILQELNDHKAQLEQLTTWRSQLEDAEAILELLEEEADETLFSEAQATLTEMARALDLWELQQMLSGPYDKSGAVLTINAGAGGTDAQDWAEMLLRMYTRWAESQNYKVALVEQSEGDEAGLKSATLEIQGRYAFGYLKSEKGTHRLVRISPFNANGKRQTSFAGIEVMPILDQSIEVDIPEKDLEIKTTLADKSISNFLIERMKEEKKGIEKNTKTLASDVEVLIKDALPSGIPSIKDVSKILGMSNRTLTRRLSDYGVSYRELIKKTQESISKDLLQNTGLSVGEIAFQTGFSEQSAFNRAFKRWTSLSPLEFRKM